MGGDHNVRRINFETPTKLVGETTESGNEYVKTYRTEILLPKGSRYEGYSFQHPAKIVSDRENGLTEVTYNDSFVFLLVKKTGSLEKVQSVQVGAE